MNSWGMKPGTILEGEMKLFVVEIKGQGGDSVHDRYFLDEGDAIIASAVDGQNKTPREEFVLKFSDGSYIYPRFIRVSPAPTREQKAKVLNDITPAQKLLLGRRLRFSDKKYCR